MKSITTKSGDQGQTGLANGQRVAKDSLVIEVLGELDELNSWLGWVATQIEEEFADHHRGLLEIQHDLMTLAAQIAQSPKTQLAQQALKKLESRSAELEQLLEGKIGNKFVLPGGTQLAAQVDVARSVCRRVERSVVKLSHHQVIPALILKFINRLSDYLYLLRCYLNTQLDYDEKKFNSD